MILQGGHLFDHDTDLDHDIDHDFDHSVGIDHDVGDVDLDVDVDVDSDLSVGIDKDIHIGMDKGLDLTDHGYDADTPAPLMLLMGTFMISFGGTGFILIDDTINVFILFAVLFSDCHDSFWNTIFHATERFSGLFMVTRTSDPDCSNSIVTSA